ncbi:2-hydroxyacyl-CoA dehydratase, partial [Intestinimonas butyriciproducens]|nr:2-hydroxyacyl-CoA dehydratase [Intestinimonas butyriciproducens]
MSEIKAILEELAEVSGNPRKQMEKYLSAGKKVVGCFPVYTPEELVHAGGMIPMGLWGGQITPSVAGKYNPIFTCSIMRSC